MASNVKALLKIHAATADWATGVELDGDSPLYEGFQRVRGGLVDSRHPLVVATPADDLRRRARFTDFQPHLGGPDESALEAGARLP
jgi:hypothetical protein